ncbi:MAG: peptidoglycan-binding protein [bacterium]|nr:peptidoglycan-binding protein [bacterium]
MLGNVAPASAASHFCYWTASSSQNMSDPTNWEDSNGGSCTDLYDVNLQFDGTTSTNATWDTNMTSTIYLWITADYTGVVTIGAANATTTGFFYQYGGTVSTTGSGVMHVGGAFVIATNSKWAGVTGMNVHLYGGSAELGESQLQINTSSIVFHDLTIDGFYKIESTYSVTTTGNLTISSDATLNLDTNSLSIGGNLSNSGTLSQTSGSVTLTGDSATLGGTGTTTPYDLTIAGTSVTLAGNVTTTNQLTINSGSTLSASSYEIALIKDSGTPLMVNGTFTAGTGKVIYTGATSAFVATTTFYNLTIATAATLSGNATTTNLLIIDADKSLAGSTFQLALTKASGTPLTVNGTFTCNTGEVRYTGATSAFVATTTFYHLTINTDGTFSGNATVGGNLTVNSGKTLALSTYNLSVAGNLSNSGTITQSAGTVTMSGTDATLGSSGGSMTLFNLTISGATTTLAGNVTSTNLLTISANKELKASSYRITLSSSTASPFVITGLFTAGTGEVRYTGTGLVTSTAATYYDLYFGTGTYFFSDSATSSNSFTNNGTTTIWTDKYLYAPVTFDNNGTITETGAIKHPVTSAKLTNSSGTEVANFGTDAVYVTVTDSNGNLSNAVADTITGSVVGADPYGDSETVTLTETGVDTGIFRSSALATVVVAGASHNNGQLEVSGDHDLSLAFTDSKESADTGSDTAAYSENTYGSGGGGSSGGSSYVAPTTVTVTTPVEETIVTPAEVPATTSETTVTVTTPETTVTAVAVSTGESAFTTAVTAKFSNYLGVGSKGDEVRQLQQLLKDLGYYTYPSITGYFGNVTKAAVVAFQKANNLSPFPGFVGPGTRAALNKLTQTETAATEETPAVTVTVPTGYQFNSYLYLGSQGEAVGQLQQLLKDLGYYTYPSITGYFGNVTKAAVVAFQKANNLAPYPGWLGPGTRAALNRLTK